MSRRRPGVLRRINTIARAEATVRDAQQKLATAERFAVHLQLRLQHLLAQVEACEREHADMAHRNGRLQQANCSLADRVWRAEHHAEQLGVDVDELAGRCEHYRQALRELINGAADKDEAVVGTALRHAAELLLEDQP